jgi:putative transposase
VSECTDLYRGFHFPAEVISHAVWLYVRFALSYRDVEELLAKRGVQVSYESVRRWVGRFGEPFAAELRRRERRPGRTWHLDEVFVRIGGEQKYLWRAVDEHGQVLDILLQDHRDTDAAERFFRTLLGHAGAPPERIVTDRLGSYGAALQRVRELNEVEHLQVHSAARRNNRAEQSHQPTRLRERRMQGFKSMDSAQRFLSFFSRICNLFRLGATCSRRPNIAPSSRSAFALGARSRASCVRKRPEHPAVVLSSYRYPQTPEM